MDPHDDPNDLPRAKLPYERHHKESEPPAQESQDPSFEPVKWKPVHLGLAIVFWGWFTILTVAGLFSVLFLFTLFKHVIEAATLLTLAKITGGIVLLGWLFSFAGQCLCCAVPGAARARGWAIGSVVGTLATVITMCVFLFTVPPQPQATPDKPQPGGETPEAVAPKVEPVVPADKSQPGGEPSLPAVATPKVESLLRAVPLSRQAKLIILAVSLVSQIMFILFIKKVALFFHDIFLADGAKSYLSLLIFHTALVGLLPPEAMIACFFWVILLGLEFILVVWFLMLLAGARKTIG